MLTLHSPARIDFFLRVVGKNARGNFNTLSLSQAIDLCDTVHFSFGKTDHLELQGEKVTDGYVAALWRVVGFWRDKD